MAKPYSSHRPENPAAVSPWRMGLVLLLTGLLTASLYPQSLLHQTEQIRWPLIRDLLVDRLAPLAESLWGERTQWWQDWLQTGLRAASGHSVDQGVTPSLPTVARSEDPPHWENLSSPPSEPVFTVAAMPPVVISRNSPRTILLVGDSLMQGMAMAIVHRLKKMKDYRVIDISRHSTGLTHPGYFNWPGQVRRLLEKETPQLMMVMLGANDMQDMRSQGRFVRFASERWKTLYAERVHDLLTAATDHAVPVIWLGLPAMRDQTLDNGTQVCALIHEQETQRAGQRYIATRKLLSDGNEAYTAHLMLEGRKTLVRANDGIHLTPQGARFVANRVLPELTRETLTARETALHVSY
ncbi:MAG: DUF459 domain-containing protein [Pseudomonadota bacterium]